VLSGRPQPGLSSALRCFPPAALPPPLPHHGVPLPPTAEVVHQPLSRKRHRCCAAVMHAHPTCRLGCCKSLWCTFPCIVLPAVRHELLR
jgi:hypothetical protein